MMQKRESGIGIVWIVMCITVIAALSLIGYAVYASSHASPHATPPASTSSTTTQTINPYAGWASYTLTNEKATFKYPATWTLTNEVTSSTPHPTDTDAVKIVAPDGSYVSINVASINAQDSGDRAPLSADPVLFIGQSDYLVYTSILNAQAMPVGTVSGASLSMQSSSITKWPLAKNNITNSQSYGNTSYFSIYMNLPNAISPSAVQSNSDLKTGKLIISSFAY